MVKVSEHRHLSANQISSVTKAPNVDKDFCLAAPLPGGVALSAETHTHVVTEVFFFQIQVKITLIRLQ